MPWFGDWPRTPNPCGFIFRSRSCLGSLQHAIDCVSDGDSCSVLKSLLVTASMTVRLISAPFTRSALDKAQLLDTSLWVVPRLSALVPISPHFHNDLFFVRALLQRRSVRWRAIRRIPRSVQNAYYS